MSNYSQNTFFAPKDNLASGNPSKVIYGSDIDAELDEISTAIASKGEGSIPATTKMLFMETAAPTGWTLVTTWDDRSITITSTAAQGTGTGGNWTITGLASAGNIPEHSHSSGNFTVAVGPFSGTIDVGVVAGNLPNTTTYNAPVTGSSGNLVANAAMTINTSHNPAAGWRPAFVKAICCSLN